MVGKREVKSMTRNEVIKALECCILRDPDDRPRCSTCPYPSGSACTNRLKVDALALLKVEYPDCKTAYHDATGCLGYGYSDNDDDPIDACKTCENYTENKGGDATEKNEVIRGLEIVKETLENECYLFGVMWINDAITLLKAEPKRGRWVKMTGMMPPEYHGHYECSECQWHLKGLRNSWSREEEMHYCPNCGALMRNEETYDGT